MSDRLDELFDKISKVEVNLISRLSDQDGRLIRMEEGLKSLHSRLDSHINDEEAKDIETQNTRKEQFDVVHKEIMGLRGCIEKLDRAEAANTGWRLYLSKLWGSLSGFLKWIGFATILAFGGYAVQASGIIH